MPAPLRGRAPGEGHYWLLHALRSAALAARPLHCPYRGAQLNCVPEPEALALLPSALQAAGEEDWVGRNVDVLRAVPLVAGGLGVTGVLVNRLASGVRQKLVVGADHCLHGACCDASSPIVVWDHTMLPPPSMPAPRNPLPADCAGGDRQLLAVAHRRAGHRALRRPAAHGAAVALAQAAGPCAGGAGGAGGGLCGLQPAPHPRHRAALVGCEAGSQGTQACCWVAGWVGAWPSGACKPSWLQCQGLVGAAHMCLAQAALCCNVPCRTGRGRRWPPPRAAARWRSSTAAGVWHSLEWRRRALRRVQRSQGPSASKPWRAGGATTSPTWCSSQVGGHIPLLLWLPNGAPEQPMGWAAGWEPSAQHMTRRAGGATVAVRVVPFTMGIDVAPALCSSLPLCPLQGAWSLLATCQRTCRQRWCSQWGVRGCWWRAATRSVASVGWTR